MAELNANKPQQAHTLLPSKWMSSSLPLTLALTQPPAPKVGRCQSFNPPLFWSRRGLNPVDISLMTCFQTCVCMSRIHTGHSRHALWVKGFAIDGDARWYTCAPPAPPSLLLSALQRQQQQWRQHCTTTHADTHTRSLCLPLSTPPHTAPYAAYLRHLLPNPRKYGSFSWERGSMLQFCSTALLVIR